MAKAAVILVVAQVAPEWEVLPVREARVCSFLRRTILTVDLAAAIVRSISTGGRQRAVPVISASTGSRQDTAHHRPGHVGKTEIAPLIFVGQLLVVQSQEVQDGGVEVV